MTAREVVRLLVASGALDVKTGKLDLSKLPRREAGDDGGGCADYNDGGGDEDGC